MFENNKNKNPICIKIKLLAYKKYCMSIYTTAHQLMNPMYKNRNELNTHQLN